MTNDFVWTLLSDIDMNKLNTTIENLQFKVEEILRDLRVRNLSYDRNFQDDVRYAPYKTEKNRWEPVCVQDFDFKDYDEKSFLIDEYPCGNIEQDAVAFYRQDIFCAFDVTLSEADDIARKIAELVCEYIV